MHIKLNDIKIIILFSPKCFLLFFWAFAVLLLCHWFLYILYWFLYNIYKTAFYSLHRVSYLSIAPLYVLVHQQCGHRVQEPAEK